MNYHQHYAQMVASTAQTAVVARLLDELAVAYRGEEAGGAGHARCQEGGGARHGHTAAPSSGFVSCALAEWVLHCV
jgi:hypothetical protein